MKLDWHGPFTKSRDYGDTELDDKENVKENSFTMDIEPFIFLLSNDTGLPRPWFRFRVCTYAILAFEEWILHTVSLSLSKDEFHPNWIPLDLANDRTGIVAQ
ncbi:uncharacterized protein ACNLHF_013991 [Anomaloglossus baeobatrachus]